MKDIDNIVGINGKPIDEDFINDLKDLDEASVDENPYYAAIYSEVDEEYLFESINDLCMELANRDFDIADYGYDRDRTDERQLGLAVLDAMRAAGVSNIDLGDVMKEIIDEMETGY